MDSQINEMKPAGENGLQHVNAHRVDIKRRARGMNVPV